MAKFFLSAAAQATAPPNTGRLRRWIWRTSMRSLMVSTEWCSLTRPSGVPSRALIPEVRLMLRRSALGGKLNFTLRGDPVPDDEGHISIIYESRPETRTVSFPTGQNGLDVQLDYIGLRTFRRCLDGRFVLRGPARGSEPGGRGRERM